MPEFAPIDDPRWSIDTMTDILQHWLTDDDAYARQVSELGRLVAAVATPGATANAATAILDRLKPPAGQRRVEGPLVPASNHLAWTKVHPTVNLARPMQLGKD
jgi:hypothetical protein